MFRYVSNRSFHFVSRCLIGQCISFTVAWDTGFSLLAWLLQQTSRITITNEVIMPALTLSNGLYSNAHKIIENLKKNSKYTIITDKDIIDQTATKHEISQSTIKKVIQSKSITFNDFTNEKGKCLSYLKQTVSEYFQKGNCLFHGVLGHFIPAHATQVMRILVMTDKKTRVKNGIKIHLNSQKDTLKSINNFDKLSILLCKEITGSNFFDESLYDIVIPTDKINTLDSLDLIFENAQSLKTTSDELIAKEAMDFNLAARIEVALTDIGKRLNVMSDDGNIVVTIDKSVMRLSKLKEKISTIVHGFNKVKSVEIKIGKNYYSTAVVRKLVVDTPTRLLLVDDEKEFVQTLSERLKLRQFQSEIAYSGKEALEVTEKENTDVMILDLKMPGIDGLEVLKKVKETKPHIEVIILTGHGSEQDKKKCMDLGAFAYLEKPTDINLLTDTMKKAYSKSHNIQK